MPVTEKRGRRHSSMVNVVVLDTSRADGGVAIRAQDVRVDTYRDTGPGGQHRNKTDSAVRLTHLPTGTVVTAADGRSQHMNREVAWERLRVALTAAHRTRAHERVNAARRDDLDKGRTFTWTGWRDEVRTPTGRTTRMGAALRGNLRGLLD